MTLIKSTTVNGFLIRIDLKESLCSGIELNITANLSCMKSYSLYYRAGHGNYCINCQRKDEIRN
jgi:hypothetical protein